MDLVDTRFPTVKVSVKLDAKHAPTDEAEITRLSMEAAEAIGKVAAEHHLEYVEWEQKR